MHINLFFSARTAAVLCAFLLVGCGDSTAEHPQTGAPQAVEVAAITLQTQVITYSERLPGRITAFKVAEIRPQVSGVIMERSFTEGGMVEEGQQLYQIDAALYQAAYDSARADVQRAKANVQSVRSREKRYAQLVAIDAVSKQEYDDIRSTLAQALADVAVAEANLATAKINLDYTKVYSPIAGRIGKSSVTEGALVTANQTQVLTKVTQLDPIYVDMTQSSVDMTRIRRQLGRHGQEEDTLVELTLEDGTLYPHKGKLQFSDVTVEETTGSVQLRALMPNPEHHLLPGMFVQARVILSQRGELLVPQKATTRDRDGRLLVWAVNEDNIANPTHIEVLREYEDQWIVVSGMSAGTTIVVEGHQKLQPGTPVKFAPTMQTPQASAHSDKAAPASATPAPIADAADKEAPSDATEGQENTPRDDSYVEVNDLHAPDDPRAPEDALQSATEHE